MSEQTYALAKSGVYGQKGGTYQNKLVTIIDDFEDADLSEYSSSSFTSTTTSSVYNGSNSLQVDHDGTGANTTSTTGLNAYPSQGDTFEFYTRLGHADHGLAFLFGVQNSSSYYRLYAPQGWNDVLVLHLDDGTKLASSALTSTASIWYRCKVDWDTDGTIKATLYDDTDTQVAQVSATDTTYSSGGVGWRWNSTAGSGTVWGDYAYIL